MSSLKDKFDDFREEPQHATWQQLLKRLDADMPVKPKRRLLLWLIPLFFIGTTAAWMVLSNPEDKVAVSNETKVTPSVPAPVVKADSNPVAYEGTVSENHENTHTTITHTPETVTHSDPEPHIVVPSPVSAPVASIDPSPIPQDVQRPRNLPGLIPVKVFGYKANALKPEYNFLSNEGLTMAPQVKEDKQPNHYALEIYYAGGISNMILRGPESSFFSKSATSNMELRKAISKAGFSYTTGFSFKANFGTDFRFKTGYYMTQVSQTLYYDIKKADCQCGEAIYLSQIDPAIGTESMVNIGDTISRGNTNSFTNKYTLREIPFVIEYLKPTHKNPNFYYMFNAGLSYMYMQGVSVMMPDGDNVGFVSRLNKTNVPSIFPTYKDAFNLVAGGGLMFLDTRRNRNIEYTIAPQFKFAVTSLSKNPRWLREYPWQAQIAISVAKRFN
jgi:hypothetical protein